MYMCMYIVESNCYRYYMKFKATIVWFYMFKVAPKINLAIINQRKAEEKAVC